MRKVNSRLLFLDPARGGVVACFAVAAMSAATPAAAGTKLYRYGLYTGTLLLKYVQPLTGKNPEGPYSRVVTDAKGRITSSEEIRGARVLRKFSFLYEGGAATPVKQVATVDGEQTGYELWTYYPDGKEKRSNHYTAVGELTTYETCQPASAGLQNCTFYLPDGKPQSHTEDTLGERGSLISRKSWKEGDTRYHLRTYNPTNGEEVEDRFIEFASGRVLNIARTAYDSNGDRIRLDGFEGDGKTWFASVEYQDGLPAKKSYHFKDSTTYVSERHYDAKRTWTGSDISVNGKPAFRFAYVRKSDGTITKTQAMGLDGQLWAEYPDAAIDEVDRNGKYEANPTLGVIYRKDPWW